jgi:hypothetical protein
MLFLFAPLCGRGSNRVGRRAVILLGFAGFSDDLHAAARDMRRRFLVALIFGIPLFAWSPMGLMAPPLGMDRDRWLLLLGTGAVICPGWPFFVATIRSLHHGVLDMAVLVLLSVGTGYGFSLGSTFLFEGPNFYEASAVLLTFILLGHWLEMRVRAGASDAMRSLLKLSPSRAMVRRGRRLHRIGGRRRGDWRDHADPHGSCTGGNVYQASGVGYAVELERPQRHHCGRCRRTCPTER